MKRHLDNFEGAFPLLLIGSALLIYAGLLASQEIGSKSSHLPLWGLLGGVGAVIVGAGIYSTFLEPSVPVAPGATSDWVTIPRAEWESVRPGKRAASRSSAREPDQPIWWEGPAPSPTAHEPDRATRARGEPGGQRSGTAAPLRRPGYGTTVLSRGPPVRSHASLKELRDALSELEALVYGGTTGTGSGPSPQREVGAEGFHRCMDCDRRFTPSAGPVPCGGCGRGLCAGCAASSRLEDGQVRCVDCRAREA